MPDIRWIKLTTEMFDDEKIRIIESMPEADTLIVLWIRLICIAGKTNDGGNIYLTPDIPYSLEHLAAIFNRPLNTVKLAMDVFIRLQMVTLHDDGTIFLPAFEKHQNLIGMERVKATTRKRVALFREKQRLLAISEAKTETKDVTLRNVTVTQQKRVEKSRIDNINIQVPDFVDKELWNDFLDMRKKLRKPATDKAQELLIKDLGKLNADGDDPNEVLRQSIKNSWQGLFPLKGGQNGVYKGNPKGTRLPTKYTEPPYDPRLEAFAEADRRNGEIA